MSFAVTRFTNVASTKLLCHSVIKQIIFFNIEKFFNVLFVNLFKRKCIRNAFCALFNAFSKSRVITEIKFTAITMMFFNLFYKMNKQILSSTFFYNQSVSTIRRLNWFSQNDILFWNYIQRKREFIEINIY